MTPHDVETLVAAVAAGRTFRYRLFWGHQSTPPRRGLTATSSLRQRTPPVQTSRRPRSALARPDGQLSDSVFSQWWRCLFTVDGVTYASAEQFMMAGKARLFADAVALAAILAADDPAACKALGRKVRGYDEAAWEGARFDLVTRGNVAKFGQAPALLGYLLATGDDVLVEASPTDTVWGIGLGAADPRARDPRSWRGRNLLGFALVRARSELRHAP